MDRRVTPPKRVTSPIWGPPPPCKQALAVIGGNEAGVDLVLMQRFMLYYVNHETHWPLWANLCGRHCLYFSLLAYDLTHRSRDRIYELNAKVERAD